MTPHAYMHRLIGRLYLLWRGGSCWRWVDEDGRRRSRLVTTLQYRRLIKCIRGEFEGE